MQIHFIELLVDLAFHMSGAKMCSICKDIFIELEQEKYV